MPDAAPPMLREFTRELKCQFTESEKKDLANNMAKAYQDLVAAQLHKKEVVASLKAREEALAAQLGMLSTNLNNGWEYRSIPCKSYALPTEKIEMVRLDTGEVLETRAMADGEVREYREMELPFGDPGNQDIGEGP